MKMLKGFIYFNNYNMRKIMYDMKECDEWLYI